MPEQQPTEEWPNPTRGWIKRQRILCASEINKSVQPFGEASASFNVSENGSGLDAFTEPHSETRAMQQLVIETLLDEREPPLV